jgi:hypothetical protein
MKNQKPTSEVLQNVILSDLNQYRVAGGTALLGFENYEAARAFADENGCDTCLFTKRDGQSWKKERQKYESLTADNYISELGDNYRSYEFTNELDWIKESLTDIVGDFDGDFTAIDAAIKQFKELQSECEKCGEDEVVIISYGSYYETVKKEMIGYHEDVTSYEVGVFVEDGIEADEEEDN